MITAMGKERECFTAFRNALANEIPGMIDFMFHYISSGSPTYRLCREPNDGANLLTRVWNECGWLACDGSYDEYERRLDRELKKNLRKLGRRLTESGKVTHTVISSDEAEPSHFQRFVRLEHSGWKGNLGTSICASGLTLNFYRVLTSRLRDTGWLRWYFMELDGRDIAAQLAVHTGSTLFLVKTAFNENYRRFAPGKLLFERIVRHGFESNDIALINCLGYGELYRPWNVKTDSFVETHLVQQGLIGSLLRLLPLKLKSMKRGNAVDADRGDLPTPSRNDSDLAREMLSGE
jgi:hypothetical protein